MWYAVNSRKGLSLHRYILGLTDNTMLVKHKNGNTLDNRRENLEIITKSESRIRSRKKSTSVNKSKFRGVWHDSRRKDSAKAWRVNIGNKYVGSFATEEEAAKAWNTAALAMYGDDAQLNKII